MKIKESLWYQAADCIKSLQFKYCIVKHYTKNIIMFRSSGISQNENASGEES